MARRKLRLADFEALLAEVDRLERMGYTRGGQWNLTQMAEHLTLAMRGSINGFETKVAWPRRMVGRLVLPIVLKYGVRARVKAPPAAVPQAREGDDAAVIARFREVIEEFRRHEGEFFAHPFFGQLTRGQWERFHLIHAEHHLGFLAPKGI